MPEASLSVLIATRNGEHVLPRTLNGYRQLKAPAAAWNLIVVDNGSTDATPGILESFKDHLPLEILREPRPGKNRALNRGLDAVTGDLIVISDDDAIPDPAFLVAWEKFLHAKLEFGLFGGTIIPEFEVKPPGWLLNDASLLGIMFAARDEPDGPIPADRIFGPNMAVRRSLFDRGVRFSEQLGPNASDPNYPMGSETEFCRRVAQMGIRSCFTREPAVRHLIRPNQSTEAFFCARSYRHGRGIALQMRMNGQRRSYLQRRLSLLKQPIRLLQIAIGAFLKDSPMRAQCLYAYHRTRGFNDEAEAGSGSDE